MRKTTFENSGEERKKLTLPSRKGVDSNGFIINPTGKNNIQPSFKPVLYAVVSLLQELFTEKVHSIYVYGSVGRGEAKEGLSDLDLTVILHSPLTDAETHMLHGATERLLQGFNTISKVDYDLNLYQDVLAKENVYEHGFWLRHMCTCLYGEDLATNFKRMKPNEKVSLALNKNFLQVVSHYRQALLEETLSASKKRTILKRMIRGVYLKINVQDESWSTDITENLSIIQHYFPDERLFSDVEHMLHSEEELSQETLLIVVESFLNWYDKQR
ncbi:nucleotidyltransferase domain-containing protein [Salipaludibacillus sp. LMS25]|jgi:predicted nucleotidyltransferase|uniref:nucleotidyltransferase domain-containing protein n=1 Tax=Salipaludibacillus sp. LMS25 TaxID=2924031 RepID=UPI0020D1495C|nr:nucleotidyltransferase domain-containing protein [Salipaludibacillus sp. LMS25]UTR15841.1 nucleotidyltransferase domain-containing protein [Salipaludibacillus sp. LMS25]